MEKELNDLRTELMRMDCIIRRLQSELILTTGGFGDVCDLLYEAITECATNPLRPAVDVIGVLRCKNLGMSAGSEIARALMERDARHGQLLQDMGIDLGMWLRGSPGCGDQQ